MPSMSLFLGAGDPLSFMVYIDSMNASVSWMDNVGNWARSQCMKACLDYISPVCRSNVPSMYYTLNFPYTARLVFPEVGLYCLEPVYNNF